MRVIDVVDRLEAALIPRGMLVPDDGKLRLAGTSFDLAVVLLDAGWEPPGEKEFGRVVRAFGSNKTHVVTPPLTLVPFTHMGATGIGIPVPVEAVCGAKLRGVQDLVVCMREGTRVKCGPCRTATGLHVAPEGNHLMPQESP